MGEAEAQTAYDAWDRDYRVRIRDNGDHIAVMGFYTDTKFTRINITREDFWRLVDGVSRD